MEAQQLSIREAQLLQDYPHITATDLVNAWAYAEAGGKRLANRKYDKRADSFASRPSFVSAYSLWTTAIESAVSLHLLQPVCQVEDFRAGQCSAEETNIVNMA